MEERYDIQRLLVLRKLTRAVADLLRGQMKEYLTTLSPLLRPKAVLGEYVQSSTKETARGADKAFKDLQELYASVALAQPFNLPGELKSPIEVISTALEVTPAEYSHPARTEQQSKNVIVTPPLKWVLTYSGFAPGRLRELLAKRNRSDEELQRFVLHWLMMHVVVSKQTGVAKILDALRFPIKTERSTEFGNLPITYISTVISTVRPSDDVIIESTELSGTDAFEEIVNLDDFMKIQDPPKEQLVEIVKSHGQDLLSQ